MLEGQSFLKVSRFFLRHVQCEADLWDHPSGRRILEAHTLSRKFITLYTFWLLLLSKQDHYVWSLKAIKPVLVIAGSLNLKTKFWWKHCKISILRTTADVLQSSWISFLISFWTWIFQEGKIQFERSVKKLQPEKNFAMKICQLDELLTVQNPIFIVGNVGTG